MPRTRNAVRKEMSKTELAHEILGSLHSKRKLEQLLRVEAASEIVRLWFEDDDEKQQTTCSGRTLYHLAVADDYYESVECLFKHQLSHFCKYLTERLALRSTQEAMADAMSHHCTLIKPDFAGNTVMDVIVDIRKRDAQSPKRLVSDMAAMLELLGTAVPGLVKEALKNVPSENSQLLFDAFERIYDEQFVNRIHPRSGMSPLFQYCVQMPLVGIKNATVIKALSDAGCDCLQFHDTAKMSGDSAADSHFDDVSTVLPMASASSIAMTSPKCASIERIFVLDVLMFGNDVCTEKQFFERSFPFRIDPESQSQSHWYPLSDLLIAAIKRHGIEEVRNFARSRLQKMIVVLKHSCARFALRSPFALYKACVNYVLLKLVSAVLSESGQSKSKDAADQLAEGSVEKVLNSATKYMSNAWKILEKRSKDSSFFTIQELTNCWAQTEDTIRRLRCTQCKAQMTAEMARMCDRTVKRLLKKGRSISWIGCKATRKHTADALATPTSIISRYSKWLREEVPTHNFVYIDTCPKHRTVVHKSVSLEEAFENQMWGPLWASTRDPFTGELSADEHLERVRAVARQRPAATQVFSRTVRKMYRHELDEAEYDDSDIGPQVHKLKADNAFIRVFNDDLNEHFLKTKSPRPTTNLKREQRKDIIKCLQLKAGASDSPVEIKQLSTEERMHQCIGADGDDLDWICGKCGNGDSVVTAVTSSLSCDSSSAVETGSVGFKKKCARCETDAFVFRKSAPQFGLFAKKFIPKYKWVIAYTGKVKSKRQAAAETQDIIQNQAQDRMHSLQTSKNEVGYDLQIDASFFSNESVFINDPTQPEAGVTDAVVDSYANVCFVVAEVNGWRHMLLRTVFDVFPGDELLVKYAGTHFDANRALRLKEASRYAMHAFERIHHPLFVSKPLGARIVEEAADGSDADMFEEMGSPRRSRRPSVTASSLLSLPKASDSIEERSIEEDIDLENAEMFEEPMHSSATSTVSSLLTLPKVATKHKVVEERSAEMEGSVLLDECNTEDVAMDTSMESVSCKMSAFSSKSPAALSTVEVAEEKATDACIDSLSDFEIGEANEKVTALSILTKVGGNKSQVVNEIVICDDADADTHTEIAIAGDSVEMNTVATDACIDSAPRKMSASMTESTALFGIDKMDKLPSPIPSPMHSVYLNDNEIEETEDKVTVLSIAAKEAAESKTQVEQEFVNLISDDETETEEESSVHVVDCKSRPILRAAIDRLDSEHCDDDNLEKDSRLLKASDVCKVMRFNVATNSSQSPFDFEFEDRRDWAKANTKAVADEIRAMDNSSDGILGACRRAQKCKKKKKKVRKLKKRVHVKDTDKSSDVRIRQKAHKRKRSLPRLSPQTIDLTTVQKNEKKKKKDVKQLLKGKKKKDEIKGLLTDGFDISPFEKQRRENKKIARMTRKHRKSLERKAKRAKKQKKKGISAFDLSFQVHISSKK